MKKVKMLADHEGAKEGDVVGFESDAEADALIADGKAEPATKPAPEVNGDAQTITAADVGVLTK